MQRNIPCGHITAASRNHLRSDNSTLWGFILSRVILVYCVIYPFLLLSHAAVISLYLEKISPLQYHMASPGNSLRIPRISQGSIYRAYTSIFQSISRWFLVESGPRSSLYSLSNYRRMRVDLPGMSEQFPGSPGNSQLFMHSAIQYPGLRVYGEFRISGIP